MFNSVVIILSFWKKTKRGAAAAKAVGGGDGSTTVDDGSTDLTVLLESWSDVEDHARSGDDVQDGRCW